MNPYRDITEVKKAKLTPAQESIYKAFIEMYNTIDCRDISVTALCKKANVARTTFYMFYGSIDDLLAEMEDGLVFDMLKVRGDQFQLSKYSENVLEYTKANFEMLHAFLIKQPNLRLMDKMKKAVKYHNWDATYITSKQREDGLVLEMIAAMTVAGYQYSLEHLDKPNIKNMSRMIGAVLSSLDDDEAK